MAYNVAGRCELAAAIMLLSLGVCHILCRLFKCFQRGDGDPARCLSPEMEKMGRRVCIWESLKKLRLRDVTVQGVNGSQLV